MVGWFKIPGIQEGECTVEDQIVGFESLLDYVTGSTVLDLGCAEGLISDWLCKAGAVSADGVDSSKDEINIGRLFVLPKVRLIHGDLNSPDTIDGVSEKYDIVLLFGILHKVKNPKILLNFALGKSRKLIAVRAPFDTLGSVNIRDVLLNGGFKVLYERNKPNWRVVLSCT